MNQRWWILGGASMLAGMVLALTLFMGTPNAPVTEPQTNTIAPGQTPPPLRSTTTQGSTPTSVGDAMTTPGAGAGAGSAQGYILRSTTRAGTPVEITGQSLDPLPQGQWKVGRPMTRIQLSEHQLIQIQAEGGTVTAPNNQARSGELRGHVTLFYFEGSPGQALDTSYGSPDLVMRLRLEDARFDLELGQIDSDGPVELDHVRFVFRGQGLSLTFNQLRQRIDHLEVFQGRSLRLKVDAKADGLSDAGGRSDQPHGDKSQQNDAHLPVYYQAQVFDKVQVTSPQADLSGDVLRVLFAMTRERGSQTDKQKISTGGQRPVPQTKSDDVKPKNNASAGMKDAVIFEPQASDVVVQWAGRLVVEPLAEKPAELAGADDMQLALAGVPVMMVTRENDRVRSTLVEYLLSGDQLRLKGTAMQPVVIESSELGVVTLPELVLEQRTGKGEIIGGGILRGAASSTATQTNDTSSARNTKLSLATTALPAGMSIAWNDRLHLFFDKNSSSTHHTPNNPVKTASTRLGPLQQASFQGAVKVIDPRLQMQADELSVVLSEPVPGRQGQPVGKPTIQRLRAQGRVQVQTTPQVSADENDNNQASGRHGGDALAMTCDRFEVIMAPGANQQPEPGELRAAGNVDAQTSTHRIEAGTLSVLLQPDGHNAARGTPAEVSNMQVERITALGQVRVTESKLNAQIVGKQVEIDAIKERLMAIGDDRQPAVLRLPDTTLTAARLELDQQAQRLTAPVPGVFVFLERDPRKPDAPPTAVTTQWSRDMSFDQKSGQVLFRGKVQANSIAQRDTMKLTCDELAILFDAHNDTADQNRTIGNHESIRNVQQVKTLAARKDVTFQSENWLDKPQGQLATRLTLQGPDLLFENARQAVQILGPGRMLFEDYRPDAGGQNEPKKADESPLRFAGGKGVTLFTWKGQLTFDTAANDMTMVDWVQMTHRPADSPNIVTLDCSRFIADLAPTGGLSSWASGSAPTPELRTVTALGPVQVTVGGKKPVQVQTSQLVYDGQAQSILLQAEPGTMTTVQEAGQPGLSAEAIRWDLNQQRWEIIRPGAGRVPMGR